MEKTCIVCDKLFRDGDRVEVLVRADYRALKSKVAYALDKDNMEAIPGTIVHAECADDEDVNGPSGPIGFNN